MATVPLVRGRYRLDRQLGEGGMGVVYAAHDLQLDRPVALKKVRQSASDADARERLKREARAAAAVSHPNVCQVHEIAEDGDDLFIVMELVDGESLADRLRTGPVALPTAVPLVLAILSALEELHRRGLVHRDLKPANVFVTAHGVKLMDFGLARPAAGRSDETAALVTRPGTVVGSPAYMAPEQALNKPVDHRTDLFAVAVMLYEMLSGTSPFLRASVPETLHAVVYTQPPSLGGSTAIGAADTIIRRGLAKRPEDRFQSAGEMARALRTLLAQAETGEFVRARPMSRLIVLPLRLLKPDPEIDFLAFGLADAIGTTLSGLNSLVVRSSLAAAALSDRAFDPKAIAAEAEVDAVLTGSLLRSGDQVRVSVQLVSTPEGTILWSHNAQVRLGDIFQLQDELSRRIIDSLSVPLSARDHQLLERVVPASSKAYEVYLRANHHFYDAQNWTLARDLYEACLGDDPTYAPAWARLGRCYRLMAKFRATSAGEQADWLRRADEAFRRALTLSPELPLAHNLYTALQCDAGASADAMARLLALACQRSGDPELFAGLVHACRYCGLLEPSVAAHLRARQLDPRVPTSVAHTYWMKGEYEKAVDDPFGAVGYVSALALASLGRERDAVTFLRDRESRLDQRGRNYLLALRALLEGDRSRSVDALDRVTLNPDPESLYYVARTYARLGEHDRALVELERAADGFFCYSIFSGDPWLDPLRTDPRFVRFLHAVEERHRRAAAVFAEAKGEQVLCCAPV